jgi:hypothetical protein
MTGQQACRQYALADDIPRYLRLNDGHMDVKVVSKQVADRQARFKNCKVLYRQRHDDTLVLADGQDGDWAPHDLRRNDASFRGQPGRYRPLPKSCVGRLSG